MGIPDNAMKALFPDRVALNRAARNGNRQPGVSQFGRSLIWHDVSGQEIVGEMSTFVSLLFYILATSKVISGWVPT